MTLTQLNTKIHKGLLAALCMLVCLGILLASTPASADSKESWTHGSGTKVRSAIITSGNDWSGFPSISDDGRWIAFASNADNLVDGDANLTADIFVFDRVTARIERVSLSTEGVEANAISTRPAISADGRFVAYESLADNLVYGDTNFQSDIFVFDRLTRTTERVSVDANGFEGNGWSALASISADGHYVAYLSDADNLLPKDTNGLRDVFLHNRMNGYTQRASIQSHGGQADGESSHARVTPSGRTVVFTSQANNLSSAANPSTSIYAHNRLLPRTIQIPGTIQAVEPDTSTGGQWIAYRLPDDHEMAHNVYVYDQLNQSTTTAYFPGLLTQHALANDGGHIAAVGATFDGESFNLYWQHLENGETLTLVEEVSDMRPAISADGNIIAYVKEISGIPQISIYDRGAQPGPTYYLSGRVTGPLGDPLALVTVNDNHGNTVYTDRMGYFFLSGMTPGQVSLSLSKEGFDFEPRGASFVVVSDQEEKNFTYLYTKVIEEARLDIGMPYDHRCEEGAQCQGAFHGFAAGQCTDLVLDAFSWGAGYDFKWALREDAKAHPEHYYQNRNPRDAFDMWRYFMYTGQMQPPSAPYQPGDMVFFDWSGDGEIDHVALVSQVDSNNQPTWLVDASGVITSNPNGLAAELPWEPFHVRSARGHARWNGTHESAVLEPSQGQFLQIGLGSDGADLHLISQLGEGLGSAGSGLPGGTFFDLIWEQNLTISDPLAQQLSPEEDVYYYVAISNPSEEEMPYYFVVQTVEKDEIIEALKFTGKLAPGEVRYQPLKLWQDGDGLLRYELVTLSRKSSGKIKP